MTAKEAGKDTFFNRELSWLGFARRVLALVERKDLPLLERVKFAGIMGMLHDEFFMKRVSGLKRQLLNGSRNVSPDGLMVEEEYAACREELLRQVSILNRLIEEELRPELLAIGLPVSNHSALSPEQQQSLRQYFIDYIQPILTPLAVDAEHPFPFISSGTINLAVLIRENEKDPPHFLRIKVPGNRPRWIPIPDGKGWVPLEQVIAANLDLIFPSETSSEVHLFRVTRGAEGTQDQKDEVEEIDDFQDPGGIVQMVTKELKARRFAGVVRLQVDTTMPDWLCDWLCKRLNIAESELYQGAAIMGESDLLKVPFPDRPDLRYPKHEPVTHPRLRKLSDGYKAIFEEIARGDILLHHPYDCFDTSVLRFLSSAAEDPDVLAIKLTIYRTSSDSPIVKALAEAARRGKQVAVLVEITARFDEAPNIAWGKYLENEGVHVAYGVESLKTHVKMALVVREEDNRIRRYAHIGTGNYHTGTARIYEDLGILTCDPEICREAATVFNELSGATFHNKYNQILVAPRHMRAGFISLVRREIEHAKAGRPSGIEAKMNQLQDREMIRELYQASRAGVPIKINVRGLCCLKPGVPDLSETIKVFGLVGRFLEHSRIYRFENGGNPEFFIGSADWMKRNLDNRVETIVQVKDSVVKQGLEEILDTYHRDNYSVWDCNSDGVYIRRSPAEGEKPLSAQEEFIRKAMARKNGPGKRI